ncbi:MAG: patatin-like phospholipase family protein [Bacillota bacterium]|nr:patatin-like phospholipase family protein [Bacillota bacterium]
MIGLVFEGGGAKGAYQIGVWKYLNEINIKIDGVVGTSVGAINSAAFAMGNIDSAVKMWSDLSIEKIVKGETKRDNLPSEFDRDLVNDIDKLEEYFLNNKNGLDITPMKEMLKKSINEKIIRNSKIDLGLVTYNLTKRKLQEIFLEDIKVGSLYKYIMASSYLPVFKAEKIDGDYFIDGGFFNNLPINLLTKKGYKKIISVRLRPDEYDYSNYRNVDIIDISPKDSLGGTLEFDDKKIQNNIELGYEDAKRILSYTIDAFIG